jgi:hypothetical protein
MADEMSLDEAISLLARVHLRHVEAEDWHVMVGATPSGSWEYEDYPRAWAALRKRLMEYRASIPATT